MLISRLNRRIRKNPIKNGRRLAAIHCDGIETARDDGRRRRRRYGGDEGEKSETDDGARPYLSGTSVNAMISAAGARPVRGRCAAERAAERAAPIENGGRRWSAANARFFHCLSSVIVVYSAQWNARRLAHIYLWCLPTCVYRRNAIK